MLPHLQVQDLIENILAEILGFHTIIPDNLCWRELLKFHNNLTDSSYYQIPPIYKKN